MKQVLAYVANESKTMISRDRLEKSHVENYVNQKNSFVREDGVWLVSGKDCCPESVYNEFMATKNSYSKANGVFFYHYDQAFADGEDISSQKAHEIALKFAEDNYPGYEVLVGTHVDNQHLHSHYIINSVSFVDGKKLHQGPDTLKKLRAYSDKICKSYGLSVLGPYVSGRTKTLGSREYRAAEKGQSWKFQLMNAIDGCMKHSRTEEEFIKNMELLDYAVRWEDELKYITYTTPKGKKVRDKKLHDNKYLKENMEHEFKYRAIETEKQYRFIGIGETSTTDTLHNQQGAMGFHSEPFVNGVSSQPADAGADGNTGDGRGSDRPLQSDCDTGGGIYDENGNLCQGVYSGAGAEGFADEQFLAGAIETGWKLSRAEFRKSIQTDDYDIVTVQTNASKAVPQCDNLGGIVNDAVSLGHHLSEIGEVYEPYEPQIKPQNDKKKAIGQKIDDHSGYNMQQM